MQCENNRNDKVTGKSANGSSGYEVAVISSASSKRILLPWTWLNRSEVQTCCL
jgi:hypothetical protein